MLCCGRPWEERVVMQIVEAAAAWEHSNESQGRRDPGSRHRFGVHRCACIRSGYRCESGVSSASLFARWVGFDEL